MLKRRRIARQEAAQAVTVLQAIPVRTVGVELLESLIIAIRLDIDAYDAYLIRCAQKYEALLITLDQGLRRLAEQEGVEALVYK